MASRMVKDSAGMDIPFTCENNYFKTNTEEGQPHGSHNPQALGAVINEPLTTGPNGDTLWLEHVAEKPAGDKWYWLMWYDSKGLPKMPGSCIFAQDHLAGMVEKLVKCFVPA